MRGIVRLPAPHFALSRRSFLTAAGQFSAAFGLTRAFPNLAAQAEIVPGKERLTVRSPRPQDLETPPALLNSWITPNDLFFVRSHLYTPTVNTQGWRLTVDGAVERPLTVSLDELKELPRVTFVVTLECAGNGRAYFEPPVAGVQWEKGAVGTARWTGVRLGDVLKKAGVKSAGRFVLLDGADVPMGKVPDFVRNVPIDKALHPDTILAYEMNGAPLPVPHGFPLRAIVPGWEGAYAVKWLRQIQVIEQEHEGFFVKTGYRYPVRRVAPGASVPPEEMAPLTGLAVKSILTSPPDGSTTRTGTVIAGGFAWAGEANITEVEVSTDNGSTWRQAKLGADKAPYAWRQFTYEWQVTEPGSYLLLSRATDDLGRTQPVAPHWNPSGYLWNVVDRIRIHVEAG